MERRIPDAAGAKEKRMGLFNRTACDGQHEWSDPIAHTLDLTGDTSHFVECQAGDCGAKSWGDTPADAMTRAQDFDRAQREGRI